MAKKVFVLFPDGIGLRNFALTNFKEEGEQQGYDVWYWNNTSFSIKDRLGFNEVAIEDQSSHPLTSVYSRVRKHIELNVWARKFKDNVYPMYKFPFSWNGINNKFKTILIKFLIGLKSTEPGIERVRERIKKLEKSTTKYHYCKKQLEEHKPDMVLCTSQRSTQAIAPLLAAQDLGIPTATFIYSWDNVPKAMLVVETDFYYVWSEHMKAELLFYYPFIKDEQVIVTGTPQFEPHYDTSLILSREEFFRANGLDVAKRYICFSGDDETTSPLDQYYLEDLAKAVRELNEEGYNLGVLYRKCPVDFTDRYQAVLQQYQDVVVSVDPIWEQIGKSWNEIAPSKEDFQMLINVCHHTELVTNVCSSTVFDFCAHNKPCIYYNYEQPQLKKGIRDIGQNYHYVHFRSMPSKEAVSWALNKAELKERVKELLDGKVNPLPLTHTWYSVIVGNTPKEACKKIWQAVTTAL